MKLALIVLHDIQMFSTDGIYAFCTNIWMNETVQLLRLAKLHNFSFSVTILLQFVTVIRAVIPYFLRTINVYNIFYESRTDVNFFASVL